MADGAGDRFAGFPDRDQEWSEDQWRALLESLVTSGLVSWHGLCALVLGHINPSQVGTSIASKKSFQSHFPARKTWEAVRQWHFDEPGTCKDCGTRLELQADHMMSKELVGKVGSEILDDGLPLDDPDALVAEIDRRLSAALTDLGDADVVPPALRSSMGRDLCRALMEGKREAALAEVADRLDNMILRCRRCNVIRRPSHVHGGKTFLTAEAALMWILLVKRPRTYQEFHNLCRAYGLTMANIRFEEAWAMAIWLARVGAYEIDPSSKYK